MNETVRSPSQGTLIVSLDLELYWGMVDICPLEKYKSHLLCVRPAVDRILELFDQYSIHATWAVVGMLLFQTKEELLEGIPEQKPQYKDPTLSTYHELEHVGENEWADPFHFGLSIIERIRKAPNQEIGSHTFSHYYCLEEGQDEKSFRADMEAAIRASNRIGVQPVSFVFPRSQVNMNYRGVLRNLGLICFRGNRNKPAFRNLAYGQNGLPKQVWGSLDRIINSFRHHTYSLELMDPSVPINLPESRFFLPFSDERPNLHRRNAQKIRKGLSYAAKHGQVYHLWWHPHNFGKNLEENMRNLEQVLRHVHHLRQTFGMQSMSMSECANMIYLS